MARIHGFPPVANPKARILILGSMPGIKSLKEKEYYANPQNAFWKIIGELTGTNSPDYATRLDTLKSRGIALWDVLKCCERNKLSLDADIKRESSLDAHIRNESANDFAAFFKEYPRVKHVFFNGSKAEQSFRKSVLGRQSLPPLEFHRLPSTSPAHAGKTFQQKLEDWKIILRYL